MALLPDLVGRIRLDMSELDQARGEAQSRGAMIGSALGTAIGSLAGGLLAEAGSRITEFVSGSIDAFAQLQDSTQAAGVVFGSSFGKVEQFADGAAKSLGISKSAALDASITFGTFGKAAGLAGDDLAGFSNGMVTLAGDMASFRGTSPEEAITAIGAAFRGEYDPIEKYGVLINANTVAQEAERLGLIKHGQELDAHSRILATQSLIYKQTTDAQGDFMRSGDSVANTQKRIAAETENAQAALGEKLAPAYLALLNAINPVIGAVTAFVGVISNVVSFLWQWKDAIAAVLIVIGILNAQTIAMNVAMAAYLIQVAAVEVATGAWTAAQWLLNAALTANPIGIVIAVLAALVAGIIVAYNHSETFRNFVDQLWASLKTAFGWVADNVPGVITGFVNDLQQAIDWVTNLVQAIESVPSKAGAALGGLAASVWNWITAGWQRAVDGVNQANQALWTWIGQIPGKVDALLGGVPSAVWNWIKGGWDRMVTGVQQANATLFGYIGSIPQKITDTLLGLPAQLFKIGQDIITGLLNGLQSLGPQIVDYLTNLIPDPVRKALDIHSPSGVMRDIAQDVMRGLDSGFQSWIPKLQARLSQITGMIQSAGQVTIAGQNIGYNLTASSAGIQGSATVGGQQVTGSISPTGQISGSAGGQTFNIDARSFGTQFTPKDVVDQILWKAKAGGLVPA